jgi:hypothetical protein
MREKESKIEQKDGEIAALRAALRKHEDNLSTTKQTNGEERLQTPHPRTAVSSSLPSCHVGTLLPFSCDKPFSSPEKVFAMLFPSSPALAATSIVQERAQSHFRSEQALQDPITTPTSPSLSRIYALLSPTQQEQLHAASALRRSRQQQRTFASTDVSSEARRQCDNELEVSSETRTQSGNATGRILVVDEDAEAKVDSAASLVRCAHTDNDKTFEPDNAGMCSQSF